MYIIKKQKMSIELENILDNFDNLKNEIENLSRAEKSELILSMKERKLSNLEPEQIENFIKFLVTLSNDQIVDYLLHIMDNEYSINYIDIKIEKFLADQRFIKHRDLIMKEVDVDDGEELDPNHGKYPKSVPRKLRKKAKKLREKLKKKAKSLIKLYK